jgi:hypothetical protein
VKVKCTTDQSIMDSMTASYSTLGQPTLSRYDESLELCRHSHEREKGSTTHFVQCHTESSNFGCADLHIRGQLSTNRTTDGQIEETRQIHQVYDL